LEKWTVSIGQASIPKRWRANKAAELPTWPQVTADWIDRTAMAKQ
jgi:hypothetical protein